MKNTPTAGQKHSFHADLEDWAEGMDYCAVRVPAEITEALDTKGPVLVLARVNDSEPFQVWLRTREERSCTINLKSLGSNVSNRNQSQAVARRRLPVTAGGRPHAT